MKFCRLQFRWKSSEQPSFFSLSHFRANQDFCIQINKKKERESILHIAKNQNSWISKNCSYKSKNFATFKNFNYYRLCWTIFYRDLKSLHTSLESLTSPFLPISPCLKSSLRNSDSGNRGNISNSLSFYFFFIFVS